MGVRCWREVEKVRKKPFWSMEEKTDWGNKARRQSRAEDPSEIDYSEFTPTPICRALWRE